MAQFIAGRYAEIAGTRRAGGQSEVYEASDLLQGGRHVAVKVVPARSDDIYRIYFERETSALRKLDHPNVAPLLDSGLDDDAGVYYVVLDWVPNTISDWVKGFPDLPGWDDVADVVALPLASALAHSHSMSVLHRDIKPANVLFDGKKPLLADFALSKIKNQVAGARDATVIGMASAPWAPPDQTSRGSARFDVYGLAATLLQCVTPWELLDFPHVARALAQANVPREVSDLLSRALSPDPKLRPADGQVFHAELQAIQRARSSHWHRRRFLSFDLYPAARRTLEESSGGLSAESVIEQGMGEASYVVPRLQNDASGRAVLTAETFRVVGDQIELMVAFTPNLDLVCFRAEPKEFDELERWRAHEDATLLDGRDFGWTARRSPNPAESSLAAVDLRALLEKAVQDSGDRASSRFRQVRLDNWSRLIDAKEALEKRLEEPIEYRKVGREGGEFSLESTAELRNSILDQERLARPFEEPGSRGVAVTVVDVDGRDLSVRAARAGVDLPPHGVLVRDRTPSRVAIRRQKNALGALRDGSGARPHLRDLVLDPSLATAPEPVFVEHLMSDLDDDKKIAVSKALGSRDVFLVEGPPGTGKTTFICEFVKQYLDARPGDRVLLVSQMHVAIDNAVSRLHKTGVEAVVRLASRDDDVAPEASHLLLSSKLAAWVSEIRSRARVGIAALAERQGLNLDDVSLALGIEEAIASIRKRDELMEALGPLDRHDRLDNEDLAEDRAELLADYLRAVERADVSLDSVRTAGSSLGISVSPTADVGELGTALDELLAGRAVDRGFRDLLETQGDWLASLNDPRAAEPIFLPTQSVVAGTCMGFIANANVESMQFDLCIIDEASRATAPELLVPMTRSKRWVMVGDTKQLPPMVEEVFEHQDLIDAFDLNKLFLTSSLFELLLGEAPLECRTRLVTQHRMSIPVGELISQTFYDGTLIHDPVPVLDPDSLRDEDRLVWFSTSRRSNRYEEPRHLNGSSSSNKLEAAEVARLVKGLSDSRKKDRYMRVDNGPLEVLVLSGYRAQCTEIERALRRVGHLDGLAVQVKTVDAVQGREADVVIFTVTRSNLTGDLGFLSDRFVGRINVALSRAREALWIVGDSEFASSSEGPLKRVLAHLVSSAQGRLEYL